MMFASLDWRYGLGLAAAVLAIVYLIVVLVFPEKF